MASGHFHDYHHNAMSPQPYDRGGLRDHHRLLHDSPIPVVLRNSYPTPASFATGQRTFAAHNGDSYDSLVALNVGHGVPETFRMTQHSPYHQHMPNTPSQVHHHHHGVFHGSPASFSPNVSIAYESRLFGQNSGQSFGSPFTGNAHTRTFESAVRSVFSPAQDPVASVEDRRSHPGYNDNLQFSILRNNDRSHDFLKALDSHHFTYPNWQAEYQHAEDIHNKCLYSDFMAILNKMIEKQRMHDVDRPRMMQREYQPPRMMVDVSNKPKTEVLKEQVMESKAAKEQLDPCVVCEEDDKPRSHAFVPCGHLCCCEGCAHAIMSDQQSRRCPLCRKTAGGLLRIYIS